MKEIEFLRQMWGPKVRRSTDLVVGITQHWAYKVPEAFRAALDIKKDSKMWTQGPILSFKDGDLLESSDGERAVQVLFANPMGWDSSKGAMYEGSVIFDEFNIREGRYIKGKQRSCTQPQFLALLISGSLPELP